MSDARRAPGCGSPARVATSRSGRSRRPRNARPSSHLPLVADRRDRRAATRSRARGRRSSAPSLSLAPNSWMSTSSSSIGTLPWTSRLPVSARRPSGARSGPTHRRRLGGPRRAGSAPDGGAVAPGACSRRRAGAHRAQPAGSSRESPSRGSGRDRGPNERRDPVLVGSKQKIEAPGALASVSSRNAGRGRAVGPARREQRNRVVSEVAHCPPDDSWLFHNAGLTVATRASASPGPATSPMSARRRRRDIRMPVDGPIDLGELPVLVDGPGVEIRGAEAGDLTIALVRLQQGHDARSLFEGLPGGLCQCPHWGFIISGSSASGRRPERMSIEPGRPSTGPRGMRPRHSKTWSFSRSRRPRASGRCTPTSAVTDDDLRTSLRRRTRPRRRRCESWQS